MHRDGGLDHIEAEYGYPCRHQNEFAVRPQANYNFMILSAH